MSKGTEASSRELKEKDSVFTEIRANSPINSLNFLTFRKNYKSQSTALQQSSTCQPEKNSKYLSNVSRLNEEIQIMNHQLELAYDQINDLTFQINELNRKHSIQVQKIHENNQKKLNDLQNESKLILANSELQVKNLQLQKIVAEKDLEMQNQQRKFNENILYLTEQYEKKLRFKENEHAFIVENLKNQFIDVIDEMKNKFFIEIQEIHCRYYQQVRNTKDLLREFDTKDGTGDSEISTALEIEQEKKQQDSLLDLQIIEELSIHENLSINPFEQSIEASNDFDKSLKQLISQISFDDLSMSDILSKPNEL
jgi:hypothetical protein